MSKPVIDQLLSLLEQYGVRHIVCSPGSRNAELLLHIDSCPVFRPQIVIDERSAAFVALGMATVSKLPVALVCTSGTALLNYAPAVAEAFYQGVPLIVISADRPEEWIDQDDSQTIRQPGSLAHFTKVNFDLDAERAESNYLWLVNRQINEGLINALRPKQGPVHFNIHLSGVIDNNPCNEKGIARKINLLTPPPQIAIGEIREIAVKEKDKRIMLVAGFMQPDAKLQNAVSLLASLPNVCIMAETVSNLHLSPDNYVVDKVLFSLNEAEEKELAPELLISIGGALISRRLKEFLRRNPPKRHLSVGFGENIVDCFGALTDKVESLPSSFISAFARRVRLLQQNEKIQTVHYSEMWAAKRESCKENVGHLPWSDLKALSLLMNSLPRQTNLFLSNGTSVRYGQIIRYPITHATYSNRGVSGIEGSTSTAVGASMLYDHYTCLITGDMSFAYDIAGLTFDKVSPLMRIVVLDNGGGDIFRFIKATRDLPIREKYLAAERDTCIGLLADANSWIYFYADSEPILKKALKEFFTDSLSPMILHIDTRSANPSNSDILRKFLNI